MTHAVVLIKAQREALGTLGERLADVEGLRVPRQEELADLVTGRLAALDGIAETYTMVAFQAFSRHDLEALFSIGA
jgi:hypothetical protein